MDLLFAAPVSSFEAVNAEDEVLLRFLEGHQYPTELDLVVFKNSVLRKHEEASQTSSSRPGKGAVYQPSMISDDVSPVSSEFFPTKPSAMETKRQLVPVIHMEDDDDDDLRIEPSEPSTSSPRNSMLCESIGTAITTPSISTNDRNSMDDDEIRSIHEEPTPNIGIFSMPVSINVQRRIQIEEHVARVQAASAAAEVPQYNEWSWPPPPKRRVQRILSRIGSMRTGFKDQDRDDEKDFAVSASFFKENRRAVLVRGFVTPGNMVMLHLRKKAPEVDCVACMESHPGKSIRQLSCGHRYCKGCLRQLALSATEAESTMPPKCCNTVLAPALIKSVLSRNDQIAFSKKVLEYQTPHEKRLFCPNSRCGSFIHPRKKGERESSDPAVARCQDCSSKVCRICKNPAHPTGMDCPNDWQLSALLEMGQTEGWRRCYRCRALVELTDGCSHMRCRCGAEFCYICGSKWEFQCPQNCPPDAHWVRRMQREQERASEARAAEAAQEAQTRQEEDLVRHQREAVEMSRLRELQEAEERSMNDPLLAQVRGKHAQEREDFERYQADVDMKMKRRHYEERMDLLFAHSDSEMKCKLDAAVAQETHEALKIAEENLIRQKHEKSVHLLKSQTSENTSSKNIDDIDGMAAQRHLLAYLSEMGLLKSKYRHLKEAMDMDQQFQEKLLQYRHREERDVMTKRHNAEEELARREILRRKIALVDSQRIVMRRVREQRIEETGLTFAPEVETEA